MTTSINSRPFLMLTKTQGIVLFAALPLGSFSLVVRTVVHRVRSWEMWQLKSRDLSLVVAQAMICLIA